MRRGREKTPLRKKKKRFWKKVTIILLLDIKETRQECLQLDLLTRAYDFFGGSYDK